MTEQPTNDATEPTTDDTNPVDSGPSVAVEENDGITTTSTIPQDAPEATDADADPDYTETEGTKDTAP